MACGQHRGHSDLSNWKSRIETIFSFVNVNEDDSLEPGWFESTARQAEALVERVKTAARDGEPVRIWWSDSAEETCGFYWAMTLLQHENANVTQIKIPNYMLIHGKVQLLSSTGSLEPELFPELLPLERTVSAAERSYYAKRWNELVLENAPLRAVINGTLCSVPEDFYDFVVRRALHDEPAPIVQVIAAALMEGPAGITNWWYEYRIQKLLAAGEIVVREYKKPFYRSLIEEQGNKNKEK